MDLFRQYIDKKNNYVVIHAHLRQNRVQIIKELSDDVYSVIVRCLYQKDLQKFIELDFPWMYLQNISIDYSDVKWKASNYVLHKKDLEINRLEGMTSPDIYFKLLEMFLKSNNVQDLPESFVNYFKNLDCNYLINLRFLFSDHTQSPAMKTKLMHVLIIFVERYDMRLNDIDIEYSRPQDNQEYYFYQIIESINTHLVSENNKKYYSHQLVTPDNIMDIFFSIYPLIPIEWCDDTIFIVLGYFRWMKMDEQINFWNLFVMLESKSQDNIIRDVESDEFMKYLFDHSDRIDTEEKIRHLVFNETPILAGSPFLYPYIIQKYPNMRNDIMVYLLTTDIGDFIETFPGITNQEVVFALREKIENL